MQSHEAQSSEIDFPSQKGAHPGALVGEAGTVEVAVAPAAAPSTVSTALTEALWRLGVSQAYGVIGGAVAALASALDQSPIDFIHCRHETGAAFAACEASLADGRPRAVFTTSGPGLLNAVTGCVAAGQEGARLILLSASTPMAERERGSAQETYAGVLPADLFKPSNVFDYAVSMTDVGQLPSIVRSLAVGLQRRGRFVAHVNIPIELQSRTTELGATYSVPAVAPEAPSGEAVERAAHLLAAGPFVIWVGFGARDAAPVVRALAERSGAAVMATPRAKGVFPEDHPAYLGVTGLGGHSGVTAAMARIAPKHVLVLGSALRQASSSFSAVYLPEKSFVQVDLDPAVIGAAYPGFATLGVHADVGEFLRALLAAWPSSAPAAPLHTRGLERPTEQGLMASGRVRPSVLFSVVQERVVERSNALVMAECGNAFVWANHLLRFAEPGRYRASVHFGSMGHMAAGVLGPAHTGRKAVALVGDGSMLMNNELSTAVAHGAPAVWIILNDGGYGMCQQGLQAVLGWSPHDLAIPTVDFTRVAAGLGANAMAVLTERELPSAIDRALAAAEPFVLDVHIDAAELSPAMARYAAIKAKVGSKPN